MKEPEYYGRARRVDEGSKPVNNFKYLEDLTRVKLNVTRARAFLRRDFSLEKAASEAMKKQYLKFVRIWFEEVDKKIMEDAEYLMYCNEIIRVGLSDHQEELLEIWPHLKEKADTLAVNLRAAPDCPARKTYQSYCGLVELLLSPVMTYE